MYFSKGTLRLFLRNLFHFYKKKNNSEMISVERANFGAEKDAQNKWKM